MIEMIKQLITTIKGREVVGFTLVEVLVTVAIMTVVLLGFAQMTNNNMRAQKGVQDSSDLNTFQNGLQQVMNISSSCAANLAGPNIVGNPIPALQFNVPTGASPTYPSPMQYTNSGQTNLTAIYYPKPGSAPNTYVANTSNPLVQIGQPYANSSWTVSNMGVQVQGTPGPNQYYITVEVDFQKKTGANSAPVSIGSSTGLRQTTALTVTTSPGTGTTVQVTGCGASGAASSWVNFSGLPANTDATSNKIINFTGSNIANILHYATGKYYLTFTTPLSNPNYAVLITGADGSTVTYSPATGTGTICTATNNICGYNGASEFNAVDGDVAKTTTGFGIFTWNSNGTAGLDNPNLSIMVLSQ